MGNRSSISPTSPAIGSAERRNIISMVMEEILIEASKRRDDAAHSGSHHDGGASNLEDQVCYYRMGRDGTFPPSWTSYQIKVEERLKMEQAKLDPNYAAAKAFQKKYGRLPD